MKKTISILLTVLMLVGCMSICFSASAAGDTLTVGCGLVVCKNNGRIGIFCDIEAIEFYKNSGTSNWSDVTDQFKDNNDPYLFSDDISVEYYYGSGSVGFVTLNNFASDFFYLPANATGFIFVLKNASSYSSVEIVIDNYDIHTSTVFSLTKNGAGNWVNYPSIASTDLDVKPVDRLDITFSANPVPGANIGSDYSIDATATAATTMKFAELKLETPLIETGSVEEEAIGISPDYVTNSWWRYNSTYVAITDQSTGKIVYPHAKQMTYAPPKKVSSPTVHGEDANGVSETYVAGKEYSYHATIGLGAGYKFTEDTVIYLNGQSFNAFSFSSLLDDNLLIFKIDSAAATTKVNAVNIEFSADPKEGTPVGSDYAIKITPNPDIALKSADPFVNGSYQLRAGQFFSYQPSYVAVYESNKLLYPGFTVFHLNYAPVQSSDPNGDYGVAPVEVNGSSNADFASTPSVYALGKTYKYYAILSSNDAGYAFDANTVFNVNGVKATDVTLSADGKSAQVFVGEKSATELVVPHQHSLIHFPAVAATTEKEGNVEYWYCDGCKKYFGDAAGNQQLEKVTIEKLTPTTPSNPQNPQGGEDQKPAKTGSCKYCGEDHTGFAGFFVKIIHSILALFGLRKK